MRYKGSVYRPPSEAYSLIVQVTYGCSHNTCAFCSMYKEKRFALRPLEEVLEDFRIARGVYRRVPVRIMGAQHEPVGKQRFADVAFSPNQDNHFATPFRQILFGRVRGAKKPSRGPFSGKGSFPAQGKNRLEEDFCPAQTPFQGLFYLRSSPKSQVYRKATSSPACTVCCDALWEKLSPLTK